MESRSNAITFDEAKLVARRYCTPYRKPGYVFRGIKNFAFPYAYVKPAEHERRSHFANRNYYTLLLDNLPSWKNYPKRSKSIVCSTNFWTSMRYGDVYLVLPCGDPTVAIAPKEDIWFSFEELKDFGIDSLKDFNEFIEIISFTTVAISDKNYPQMIGNLKRALELFRMQTHQPSDRISRYADLKRLLEYFVGAKNIEKALDDLLSPQKNDFTLKQHSSVDYTKYYNQEVWTDSPSLLIRVDSGMKDEIDTLQKELFNTSSI